MIHCPNDDRKPDHLFMITGAFGGLRVGSGRARRQRP